MAAPVFEDPLKKKLALNPLAPREDALAAETVPGGSPIGAKLSQSVPETTTLRGDPQAAYNVEQVALNPLTDSIAGAARKLSESGSPLMQMSDTEVKQRANAAGVLNTTMTQGAMEAGRLSQAVPIATADVANALQIRSANVEAINKSRAQWSTGQQALQQINLRGQIDKELQSAEGETRMKLLSAQGALEQQMAAQRQGYLKEQMGLQAKIDQEMAEQRKSIDLALVKAQGEESARLQEQRAQLDLEQQRVANEHAKTLQAELGGINQQLETLRNTGRLAELEKGAELDRMLQSQAEEARTALQALVGAQALEQRGLEHEQALALTKIETDNKTLLQTSQSAAQAFTSNAMAISEIMAAPDIPQDAKQNMIDQQTKILDANLSLIGGLMDHDLGDYLKFDYAKPVPQVSGLTWNQVGGWSIPESRI